jgi:hypothetical protein
MSGMSRRGAPDMPDAGEARHDRTARRLAYRQRETPAPPRRETAIYADGARRERRTSDPSLPPQAPLSSRLGEGMPDTPGANKHAHVKQQAAPGPEGMHAGRQRACMREMGEPRLSLRHAIQTRQAANGHTSETAGRALALGVHSRHGRR